MSRIKRGRVRPRKRRAFLKLTKGYHWGRKNLIKRAKTASKKAGVYALRDRRAKKRVMRGLWQIQLNALARQNNLSYSRLIGLLKKNQIGLDRKVLAELANHQPAILAKILEKIK